LGSFKVVLKKTILNQSPVHDWPGGKNMKKLISLLSILFVLTLFVPPMQAEAAPGPEGSRRLGGPGGDRGYRSNDRYRGRGWHEDIEDQIGGIVDIVGIEGIGGPFTDLLSVFLGWAWGELLLPSVITIHLQPKATLIYSLCFIEPIQDP
jgi:hypothetical protein